MRVIERVKRYRNAYKNWESCMYNIFRKRETIQIILRNGEKFQVNRDRAAAITHILACKCDIPNLTKYIKDRTIEYKGVEIALEGSKGNGDIEAVFIFEDYKLLGVKNEIVIDIGANIGDSAIYFILNGAMKVIALEPYPFSYNSAVRNIKKYSMQEKVILLNAGYSSDKSIKIKDEVVNGSSNLVESNNGVDINLYSLKSLIEKYDVNEAVLKMDCEGCEYNLLNEDEKILKKFKRIELEFHYGYKNIEQKLRKAGFHTEILKVDKSRAPDLMLKTMALNNNDYTFGLLYAD